MLPTLLFTTIGVITDSNNAVTMDAKRMATWFTFLERLKTSLAEGTMIL